MGGIVFAGGRKEISAVVTHKLLGYLAPNCNLQVPKIRPLDFRYDRIILPRVPCVFVLEHFTPRTPWLAATFTVVSEGTGGLSGSSGRRMSIGD